MTLPKPSGAREACGYTLADGVFCAEQAPHHHRGDEPTFGQLVRHGYVVLPPVRTVAIPREIGDGVISDDWGDF